MAQVKPLTGLVPTPESIAGLTTPPYDVIRPGSELEESLKGNPLSHFHVILGPRPAEALQRLVQDGHLKEQNEPVYVVYNQKFPNGTVRTGVLLAMQPGFDVRTHERTFQDKVNGRKRLTEITGYSCEPIFMLTRAEIALILDSITTEQAPDYDFVSRFGKTSDLDGIRNRLFMVSGQSDTGLRIQALVNEQPLYIADGHHRHEAALQNGDLWILAYVTPNATIQAYNRLIRGVNKFADALPRLDLRPAKTFERPPKGEASIHSGAGTFLLRLPNYGDNAVQQLDCSRLERALYDELGITAEMMRDPKHFDYMPEAENAAMQKQVDEGCFDIAVALHPASIEEVMAVADAGLVMPQKATYFAPKILSGIFLLRL